MSGTTTSGVTDEMLMAFVDGELDEQSAKAVSRAIEDDPEVARRAAVFETSRAAVVSAFAGVLSAPPPGHLVDLIEGRTPSPAATPDPEPAGEGATVLAFSRPSLRAHSGAETGPSAVQGRRPSFAPPYALPLAACLALAVGLGSGIWIGQRGNEVGRSLFGSGGALTAALATQPSGPAATVDIDGATSTLSILGTYVVEGGLCRTFQLEGASEALRGVACDRGEGFAVDVAVAAGTGSANSGFSPASDSAAESLDAYLDTLEAEGPLSEAEESVRLTERPPAD